MNRPPVEPPSAGLPAVGAAAGAPPWPWVRLVVGSLCQTLLAMLVFFALWAALPALLGWEPTTVSSGSMMPRLRVGDVAVARPLDRAPALDQVLLFDDPDHPGKLRLHRFVRVDDQGRMITRGDANTSDDSTPITMDAVQGVAVLRVPSVALPIVWLREGRWVPLGLASVTLVLVLAGSGLHRSQGSSTRTGGGPGGTPPAPSSGRPRRTRSTTRNRRPRWVRPGVALVALVTALGAGGLIAAAPAWAGFAVTTTNPDSSFSSANFYRCSSVVLPLSPTFYYPLNEASGSVATDSSPNRANGTLQTGYTRTTSGICTASSQPALTLNGTSGYLSTPTQATAPNTFTAQVWFKTTTTGGGRIIGFGNLRTGASSSADRHVYLTNAGQLVFGVQTGNNQRQTITSATGLNDGTWHLATATLSSAGMRLYVDDTLVASRTGTTSGISYTGYWRVGYDTLTTSWTNSPTSDFFAGSVAQVAVYPSALTAQSVADIYGAGRP